MIFGKKAEANEERLTALESEIRRLTEELERAKKECAEIRRLHAEYVARSMELEGRAATLNFQVFSLSRDRQTLEMHESALRSENEQLLLLLKKAREEIESLKSRLGPSERA